MGDIAQGIILIIVGVAIIVFRKQFAVKSIQHQNRFWGFHFGEKEIKIGERMAFLFGPLWIILGILCISGWLL